MTYEQWRITFQSSEQAARAAFVQLESAVLAEREACAKVCEDLAYDADDDFDAREAFNLAAEFIRNRPLNLMRLNND